ncbi:hypothetical protein TNIN_482871 [Trichonephila inaurata madagascariensis]|uniref:protein-serine/threonine phosphatase n=1 Tax=Trichonephila inaurata madagascariensis TaxID=2747483 RepID=A0A8X6XQ39_9ARAC|nr:hypothetical protein TNIN_482871 [Trichonephila inaurata madagascariensis]
MGCAGSTVINNEKKNKKLRVMSATERTFKAAILIQKWYRRYLAREEVRRRCTWTIFTTLEYAGEQDQTKLYNFFTDLILHLIKSNPQVAASIAFPNPYMFAAILKKDDMEVENLRRKFKNELASLREEENQDTDSAKTILAPNVDVDELMKRTGPKTIKVEKDYKGLRIKQPMNAESVIKLIEYYKHRKSLHARYVLSIIHTARKLLRYKPNINYASTVHSKQITVCGDLHGKLEDLLTVFYKVNIFRELIIRISVGINYYSYNNVHRNAVSYPFLFIL